MSGIIDFSKMYMIRHPRGKNLLHYFILDREIIIYIGPLIYFPFTIEVLL